MSDLTINLLASAIAGLAVWISQKIFKYRKMARIKAFFGLSGSTAFLVVAKQARSEYPNSIEQADVSAMVELAVLLKSCDVTPRFFMHHDDVPGVGEEVEFCIGGPMANVRTAAHLRWHFPGITQSLFAQNPDGLTIYVGDKKFSRVRAEVDYALVSRVFVNEERSPIFIIFGQTALANEAAARYLVKERDLLARKYGNSGNFCFVLGVFGREVYGSHFVRFIEDVTEPAFAPTPPGAGPADGAQRDGSAVDHPR
jgi:hypothetical protein